MTNGVCLSAYDQLIRLFVCLTHKDCEHCNSRTSPWIWMPFTGNISKVMGKNWFFFKVKCQSKSLRLQISTSKKKACDHDTSRKGAWIWTPFSGKMLSTLDKGWLPFPGQRWKFKVTKLKIQKKVLTQYFKNACLDLDHIIKNDAQALGQEQINFWVGHFPIYKKKL